MTTVHVNSTRTEQALRDVYRGVLLGTAVGDALGLPAENLSPESIQGRWKGEWRMRLVFGRGMISDDTEHTLLVAQALLSHARDAAAFSRMIRSGVAHSFWRRLDSRTAVGKRKRRRWPSPSVWRWRFRQDNDRERIKCWDARRHALFTKQARHA